MINSGRIRCTAVAVTWLLAGCGTATPTSADGERSATPLTSPSAVGSVPEAPPAPEPGGNADGLRATGGGDVTVDGMAYALEVAVCGWYAGNASSPLQAEPGGRQAFQIVAVQRVGGGMIAFDLDWDGVVGNIDVSVLLLDPDDLSSAFHYFNDRQPIHHIAIDGGHVATVEPLTVYDGSNVMTAGRHELVIDLRCDFFGGTLNEAPAIVAEITGIEPTIRERGEVTVNGEPVEFEVSSCSVSGETVELEAESTDGSISLTFSSSPGFTLLFFSVEGRVLSGATDVNVVLDRNRVRTETPVRGEIAGRGPAEVTFDLPCP